MGCVEQQTDPLILSSTNGHHARDPAVSDLLTLEPAQQRLFASHKIPIFPIANLSADMTHHARKTEFAPRIETLQPDHESRIHHRMARGLRIPYMVTLEIGLPGQQLQPSISRQKARKL
jgi:hypothetical protein